MVMKKSILQSSIVQVRLQVSSGIKRHIIMVACHSGVAAAGFVLLSANGTCSI